MNPDIDQGSVVSTTEEIGSLIRLGRNGHGISQMVAAGVFGSGYRFISDAENGIQAQKLLDLLGMVGLDVVIRRRQTGA